MYRYLLAIALVVGPVLAVAHGQYARIRINLKTFKLGQPSPGGNQGNMGGFPGGGGGLPGGGGGLPGGGGGLPGGGGGLPGGGGGGAAGGGGFPGGGGGFPGRGGGGFPGGGGGFPGRGGGGFPGAGTGGFPGQGGTTPKEEDEVDPIWIEARLRVNKVQRIDEHFALLEHAWGKTVVPIKVLTPKGLLAEKHIEQRYKEILRPVAVNDNPPVSDWINMARWSLEHGLIEQFKSAMEKVAEKAPDHAASKAYLEVVKRMQKAPEVDDPSSIQLAADLEAKGYNSEISEQGHYKIFYTKAPQGNPLYIKQRLQFLEKTYQNFFYWFALRGKMIAPPPHRLIAVLEESSNSFRTKKALFDNGPVPDDGFTVRRDNVIFLSASPVDPLYDQLSKTNTLYQENHKLPARTLLQGGSSQDVKTPMDLSTMQTLALIQKVIETDTARQATSHEGARQLLAATGLLPRNVATAQWLQYGIASFFETPRQAFYDSTGMESWTNLVNFKYFRKSKKLKDNEGAEVIGRIVTDRYMNEAKTAFAQLPSRVEQYDEVKKAAQTKLDLARATAWALTYYLMNNKLDGMLAYMEEIKRLPPDVEYDANVLAGCFGRAFGMSANNPGDPNQVQLSQMRELGTEWYSRMESTLLEIGASLENELIDELVQANQPRKDRPTTQPGQRPGGFPGGPGGGFPGGGFPGGLPGGG